MAMSKEQRSELAAKLEKDIDDFVAQLKPKKYEDGWSEDKWEEEMEEHPLFMSKAVEDGSDLPPIVEAMQQLKYDDDENTPEELAKAYKEDGNQKFKVKNYERAVELYTVGIVRYKCKDDELNAQLYSNRAAARRHLGHYNEALEDAIEAKSLKPGYLKAVIHGAQCCFSLKLYDECATWCEEGLKLEAENSELKGLKETSANAKQLDESDKREASAEEQKRKKESSAVLKYIKEQGINFDVGSVNLETLKPNLPQLPDCGVHFDENGCCLVWPVLILYPEYEVTDSIINFHEDSLFIDHLSVIFNPEETAPFDKEKKYKLDALQIYFGHRVGGRLVEVDMNLPLKAVLCDNRYLVQRGLPSIFVTVKDSKFDKAFREENGMSS